MRDCQRRDNHHHHRIRFRGQNSSVLVDGAPAREVSVINNTTLTAVTPEHADGTVSITVTTPFPGGGTVSMPNAFTYRSTVPAPLPSIPVGTVDTPTDHQTGITGAIPFTGWVLDDSGAVRVAICRDPAAGESIGPNPKCGGAIQVHLGDGVFIEGAALMCRQPTRGIRATTARDGE